MTRYREVGAGSNLLNEKYYPWVLVALLWFVALLNYMDRQMLSTMQEAMKVDIAELNHRRSFRCFDGRLLVDLRTGEPLAGIIADRVNRKWLVVGSIFVWSAVTYLMGYAESFDQLYWLRAFMGISEALYIPAALSLIADWHEGKSRSLAIGIHMTGLYVGQAVWWFWCHLGSDVLMACRFPLVWYHRYYLFSSITSLLKGES